MKSTSKIVAMNLVALAGLVSTQETTAQEKQNQPQPAKSHADSINQASLKSIESSWMSVPMSCKSRGFNADPTPRFTEAQSDDAAAVYNAISV